ncbi:MAG: MFS transporter, partial [Mycobacteriales bacterium]
MTATIDTPPVPDGEDNDFHSDPAYLQMEMLDSGVGVGRPGRVRRARDMFSGWAQLRHTPYGLTPAVMLSLLFGIQALDGAAFTFAGPEFVRRGITIPQIINVLSVIGFVTIFLRLLIGYYLERRKRLPILLTGQLISGVTTCFTGYSTTTGSLGVTRGLASGIGDASSAPSFALLADYYPPETRGRVFSLVGVTQQTAELIALPLAAAGLVYLGLRTTFVISGMAIILITVATMVLLREPIRGFFERRSAGLDEAQSSVEEEPLSFGEAFRTIFAVRTIRRLFVSDIVGGLGGASRIFLIFLLSEKYGLGPFGLALYQIPPAIAAIVSGAIGGQYVDRLIASNPARALTLFGAFTATSGIG